ncbi:helix-turn-helix domain-containing protein [Comamonas sp.]|uniref:AraC family transcriptional regulator n=1 Tax=Comamonas sp. TaxID=34028 RepID=UPI003A912F35
MNTSHQFYRHAQLAWAELRVSRNSAHCYRLHMHAEYSLGIVDAGQARFQHPQKPGLVVTGDVVLIEPGVWHACNPEQVSHWSYRMLYLDADWLHARLGLQALDFVQPALRCPRAAGVLEQLCTLIQTHSEDQARLTRASDDLLALISQHGRAATAANPAMNAEAINLALSHLHQSPEDPPSVLHLAQACGMSASRFIRHFKAATGVTPGAYRLNLRLNGARRLLAQGSTLSAAAHSMGFADQAHLQRSFKAHHALTPGSYARTALPR